MQFVALRLGESVTYSLEGPRHARLVRRVASRSDLSTRQGRRRALWEEGSAGTVFALCSEAKVHAFWSAREKRPAHIHQIQRVAKVDDHVRAARLDPGHVQLANPAVRIPPDEQVADIRPRGRAGDAVGIDRAEAFGADGDLGTTTQGTAEYLDQPHGDDGDHHC